jgi:uncharacterized protein
MRLYNDYSSYLKSKYGCKVYRIGLDAGFTCPNRDGSKGINGCIYCDEQGSRSAYTIPALSVSQQLSTRIEYLKKEKEAKKFIAYFQAFTNTYAPIDRLKTVYDQVLSFPDIVGLSIGTRPDAIDREKISLIASYKDRFETWIEYGAQSAHDKSLAFLKRGHTHQDFVDAVRLTKEFGILVCAHVILGIPGETADDVVETAKCLSRLGVDAVKIHLLHVLKGSALEDLYREGNIGLLRQDEYVGLTCDFLENLSPEIIIQRLTGQGSRKNHIAPEWAFDKMGTIGKIEETLNARMSKQGSKTKNG